MSDDILGRTIEAVRALSDRDQAIMTYRFGLDGDGGRSLKETCSKFGVTRERVRRLEAKVLKKVVTRPMSRLTGFLTME